MARAVSIIERDPYGVSLRDENGGTLYVGGPEAEQFAHLPDERTAQAAPPDLAAGVDQVFGQYAAPQQTFDAQPTGQAPAPQQPPLDGGMSGGGPMMSQAPPPPAEAPQAPPDPMDQARRAYITAPTPGGVKPGNTAYALQQGAKQVEVPTSFSYQGGQPDLPGGAQMRADIRAAEHANAVAGAERATEAAFQEQVAAGDARELAEVQAARAAQRQGEMEQTYSRQRAEVQDLMDRVASKQVDPGRLFDNAGTFGSIVAVVAQGIGAWGATMGGTQNFAANMIDKAVERDIAAQEAEIRRGDASVMNALKVLELKTGDMDVAKEALRYAQKEAAMAQAREIAAGSKRPEIAQALSEWEVAHAKAAEEQERKIYQTSMGKQTLAGAMDIPQAPRAYGGGRPTPLQAIERAIKWDSTVGKAVSAGAAARGEADPAVLDLHARKEEAATKARMGAEEARAQARRGTSEELYVPGWGEARTKEEAKQIRGIMAEKESMLKLVDEIIAAGEPSSAAHGIGKYGTPAYTDALSKFDRMRIKVAKGMGGVITQGDIEQAGRLVPDPTSPWDTAQKQKAENLKREIELGARTWIRQSVLGGGKALEGAPTPMKVEE